MNKSFLIAWVVIFVLWMAGGILVHGILLGPDYMAMGTMRPEAEQQSLMGLMLLAHLILAGAFVWIYARGVENKPWLGQGLRFVRKRTGLHRRRLRRRDLQPDDLLRLLRGRDLRRRRCPERGSVWRPGRGLRAVRGRQGLLGRAVRGQQRVRGDLRRLLQQR